MDKLFLRLLTSGFCLLSLSSNVIAKTEPQWSILTEVHVYGKHAGNGWKPNDDSDYIEPYNEKWQIKSLGLRRDDFTLSYSHFKNSYYENSNMIALEYDVTHDEHALRVDFGLGVVDGYDKEMINSTAFFLSDNLMAIPLFALSLKKEALKFGPIQLAPKLRAYGIKAFMFNVEVGYLL